LRSLAWGHPQAAAIDPVEKKPLYHFLPGREVLSFGTLGCNLSCRFCQNDVLSRPSPGDIASLSGGRAIAPEEVAAATGSRGIPMVAFTYNEPAVWAEWVVECAVACRAAGVRTVAVTNGYIVGQARRDFFGAMDAANVDLKSFDDAFYRRQCGARLGPVLETLEWIRNSTACWLEVTTLLIPGLNDSDSELDALSRWIADHLGTDTPLHFSAFHGACEMAATAPTPQETLLRARHIAQSNGLRHVYLGNVRLPGGGDTRCAACGALLVERSGFAASPRWKEPGKCPACGTPCPGVWTTDGKQST
jgi:pyruvate formate lyase activating enzyme